MERQQASRLIKIITLIWFILGLVIALAAYMKWITLGHFQIAFPIGFFIWVVLVTLLSQIMTSNN